MDACILVVKTYLWNILIWIDQGINTILGGDPDETVSSRAGKAQQRGKLWGCVLCRLLDMIQKNHCKNNIELDEGNT